MLQEIRLLLARNVVILKPGNKQGDSARWFPAKRMSMCARYLIYPRHSPPRYLDYFSCPTFVHAGNLVSQLSPEHKKTSSSPSTIRSMTCPQVSTLKSGNKFSMAQNPCITCQAGATSGAVQFGKGMCIYPVKFAACSISGQTHYAMPASEMNPLSMWGCVNGVKTSCHGFWQTGR